MKRYTVIDIMRTTTDGTETYYSRADLIAAGCLVPVPDGEAVPFGDVDARFIEYDGHIYQWNEALDHDKSVIPIYGGGPVGIRLNNRDVRVQPVRLVRLEDAHEFPNPRRWHDRPLRSQVPSDGLQTDSQRGHTEPPTVRL